MNTSIQKTSHQFRRAAVLAVAVAIALAAYAVPQAQTTAKKAMTIDDYTKWRSIAGQEISPDGKWVAYTLQFTNTVPAESKPVLHLLKLDTNEDVTVADATGATFSPDSKWVVYHVDPWAAATRRARRPRCGRVPGARARRGAGGDAAAWRGRAQANAGTACGRRAARSSPVASSCAIWRPAPCVRGRTSGRSPSPPRPRICTSGDAAAKRRGRRRPPRGWRAASRAAACRRTAGRRRTRRGDRTAWPGPVLLDLLRHRALPVARQRGRHRLQQDRRIARLRRGRGRKGRQRPLRLRHAKRAIASPLDNDAKRYNRLTWTDDRHRARSAAAASDVERCERRTTSLLVFPT